MPIQFDKPMSMYVDPRSVKIGDTLRQRYAANFASADALDEQLAALKVADFQGDQQLKKQLMDSTREQLEQLANRGDYEHLSLPVAKAVREYTKQSAPLEENFQKYEAYKASVEKMYADGDIDADTYKSAVPASSHGYDGLSVDADGIADPTTYFKGLSLVKDVDIMALVGESLKGIVSEEVGYKDTRVGVGPGGKFTQTTSTGTEFVSEDRVQRAYREVLARPGVQAALAQKARLGTYAATPDQINTSINEDITSYQEEIAKGTKMLSEEGLTAEQTASLKKEMTKAEEEINRLTDLTDAEKDAYIKKRHIHGVLAPIESAILAKHVYSKSPSSSNFNKMEYDALFKLRYASNLAEQRAINAENRKNASENSGVIVHNASGNVHIEVNADPSSTVASLRTLNDQIKTMNDRDATENLSPDALAKHNRQAKQYAIDYELQYAELTGLALASGVLTPNDIHPETGLPKDHDWYTKMSRSQLSDLEDYVQDEFIENAAGVDVKNPYYKIRSVTNMATMTEGGPEFKAFEKGMKEAWTTIPQNTPIMLLDGDTEKFVEADKRSRDNFFTGEAAELKIVDVAISASPIRGEESTNYIQFTRADGQVALVKADHFAGTDYIDNIVTDPIYRLNSLTQQVVLSPVFDRENPYTLNTSYEGEDGGMHSLDISIYPGDSLDDTRYILTRDGIPTKKATPTDIIKALTLTEMRNIVL
jgi:hypothetical protein